MKFILGKKIGMSQIFSENGEITPVTLVEAGPCKVLDLMTKDRNGYEAVQIGYEEIVKESKKKKTAKDKNFKHIKEYKPSKETTLSKGDVIDVSIFEEGEKVTVSGKSKGKGFQGGMKRWGFSGGRGSHGVKHTKRTIGSIGSAFPQRVIKGRKMPRRAGYERITVKGLEIVSIEKDKNIFSIKGAVPGRKGTLLEIKN